ncbi:MAG: CcoQ/FixQ family Cbb3-type cytochrome c oxidase assembly chaperone [Gammaproteobacteria bacterium]|nr:CcoQ/FixQ family Cbb3-type cytochrome c oxidase assembly chaperone [Gammaproteobacteria bacterium]
MLSTIHGIWTALLLFVFIVIVAWAFSARRRDSFDRAARSVLQDDSPQSSGHGVRTDG